MVEWGGWLGAEVGPKPNIIMLKIVMTHNLFALLILLSVLGLPFVWPSRIPNIPILDAPSPILACLPSRSCRSRLPCGTSSSGALCTYFARITFLLYYLGQGCWLWSYFAPLTVFFWASSGLFCFALCMNAVLMFNIFFRASCLHLT